MLLERTYDQTSLGLIAAKARDYAQLSKLRLSSMVVFSATMGALLAAHGSINLVHISLLMLGGLLVTASSNALNQVIERDFDKLMSRTAARPLPQKRMSVVEALLFAGLCGVGGIIILWYFFNPVAGMLGAIALLSYSFIYTPLKRISPIAVLVGAIPGAIPPMIGWVSVSGTISIEAFTLFSIQFLWQFPHFWAIAWVAHDDYMKAGFKLLPSNHGKNRFSALQNIIYIAILIPVSLIPFVMGWAGAISAFVAVICGGVFLVQAIQLYIKLNDDYARKLMFGSFVYLPVVFLSLVLDKI